MSIDRDMRTACWRSLLRVSGLAGAFLVPAGLVLAFTLVNPSGLNFTASEPGSVKNGVRPNSGLSGTAFTFSVYFQDPLSLTAPGVEPSTSELHIDLNGDALLAGSLLAPALPAPAAGSPVTPALLLALVILAGVIAYAAFPQRRALVANLALVTAMGLWLFACSSGDGSANANHDGLALASCTSPTGEVVEMALADPDTPNFFDPPGEEYEVTVTLECTSGVVLFKFFFELVPDVEVPFGTAVGHHYLIIED